MDRARLQSTAFLCFLALASGPGTASAQPLEVVASGLYNPRGLAFGPEGALYVVEAGSGGDLTPCMPAPDPGAPPRCVGETGAVTRIWPLEAGHQVRIATGLPSAAGPGGGGAFITVGLGPDPANEHLVWAMSGVKFGWLVKMSASGHWKPRVDIARHEARKNPDGEVVDSNPYGVLALPGRQVVADAGGNTLLEVSANGRVKTLAVFPRRSAGGASFQAVPTAVAQGPDRAFYVGQLTGVPFPVGEACVYRVPECGGQPTCLYGGFTNIIDVAFGPSVSPGGGQVVRVRP